MFVSFFSLLKKLCGKINTVINYGVNRVLQGENLDEHIVCGLVVVGGLVERIPIVIILGKILKSRIE